MARCASLRKVYGSGDTAVAALDGVDVELFAGEFVALTGPSGSGKSTLLHLLGAMDTPSEGLIEVDGQSLTGLDDEAASRFRCERLGFVFQFFHLMPSLSAWENVALPARFAGAERAESEARSREGLARVGLPALAERFPDQMSGGQQQRVAIARALINDPALVLADEPTGNLDHVAGAEVLELLAELGAERGSAVLVATHDPAVTAAATRAIRLVDGKLDTDDEPAR
ncbi:MAG: macrolide ABC transporter ATP-binding protein [Planctomycetota bacterium]|nr:MAG: macrolide ABC transporter ATP-binding protein [Planctomycetota bacterium]